MINVALDIDFSTNPIQQQWWKHKFYLAEGQKKLFKYRNSKFAGEFKTRTMAETTSLSSTPQLSVTSENMCTKYWLTA